MKRHLMDAKEVLGMVNKLVESARLNKALSGPVAEKGDATLTGGEGAQADQAFAVAHGPDNYDQLVHKAESFQMNSLIKSTEIIAKQAGGNMNLPGNLKEHLQKALAAVHGREIFDPRYKQACTLLKKVCDLMETIEKEAEVTEGNSAAMVPGMGGGMRDMSDQIAPHGGMGKAIRRAHITDINGKKVKLTPEDAQNRQQRAAGNAWMNEKSPLHGSHSHGQAQPHNHPPAPSAHSHGGWEGSGRRKPNGY